jgi:hypothetical protein
MEASRNTRGTGAQMDDSRPQAFAEIVKGDFLLIGAFLLFLGLISTDAYYRAFGLRFQFLTYPWNLIIFRGLLTVIRYPLLWLFILLMVIAFQVDRYLARSTKFRHQGLRISFLYLLLAITISIMPVLGTHIGSREAADDMAWSTTTLPRISKIVGGDAQPIPCTHCLLLMLDSSQVVYLAALDQGDKDVLPQTKILARSNVSIVETTR